MSADKHEKCYIFVFFFIFHLLYRFVLCSVWYMVRNASLKLIVSHEDAEFKQNDSFNSSFTFEYRAMGVALVVDFF